MTWVEFYEDQLNDAQKELSTGRGEGVSRTLPQWIARKRGRRIASRAAHRSTATPNSEDSRALTLEDLREACRRLRPIHPRRWMVRAADLEPEEDARLDLLALESRPERSRYLPNGALAVIFEQPRDGGALSIWDIDRLTGEPLDREPQIATVIYREGIDDGARIGRGEE